MPSAVRVIVWNILEGFHRPASADPSRSLDEERLAAALAVLADLRPDVLVLNEASWCRPHGGRAIDYGGLLGFPHTVCDTYDAEWGNAILTHLPITGQGRFRIHNRGGIRATVVQGEVEMTVATYHPHPSRYPENKAADFLALA